MEEGKESGEKRERERMEEGKESGEERDNERDKRRIETKGRERKEGRKVLIAFMVLAGAVNLPWFVRVTSCRWLRQERLSHWLYP